MDSYEAADLMRYACEKEVLPLLLSSSPAVPLHAQHALSSIHLSSPELPTYAQLRGLIYAVRWEVGIPSTDFLNSVLEGERWLVWAAGNVRHILKALYNRGA